MHDALIVSGARTPIGSFGGVFRDVSAADLGAVAIQAAISRASIDPAEVEEVIIGNVLQAKDYGYTARLAALRAGIPAEVPAISVNRACSSGLEAINLAAQLIKTGEAEIVVAGGVESMSQAPYLLDYRVRYGGLKMGEIFMKDSLIGGLSCPVNHYHMGVGAENVQEKYGINRRDQDLLALDSHQRAIRAIEMGRFKDQIAEVEVTQSINQKTTVLIDEGPRSDTTIEGLANLKPVFKENGTVTAGNSSSISDGAAAVVMMSEDKAIKLGLNPKLKWRAKGVAGVDPAFYGIGPVPAVRKALDSSGLSLDNIGLIELNEAFAVQALHNIRELGIDVDRTNVNGSGISLGHPIGATGAIMTVRLMYELGLRKDQFGIVTMCVGGGMGVATIFEAINS